MNKRVMVALSGGVDSSVAAYLLKKDGFETVGVTMCLGIKREDSSACCGAEAINDAKKVCDKLGIAHDVLNFSNDLEDKVVAPFVNSYLQGLTPNPCVDCNKYLKFDLLLRKALSLDFNYLATGHYAGIVQRAGSYFLKKAADQTKDQTYFLYAIDKSALKHIQFPLENLSKKQVRELAAQADLPVAQKKESQDICFVPDHDYAKFVQARKGKVPAGNIVDTAGKVLGKHKGIIFYTIGQRQGLGIGGGEPYYVVSIDAKNNLLVVGEKKDLLARGLIAEDVNLFFDSLPQNLFVKIRYNSKETAARAVLKNNRLEIIFDEPQSAVTPGQSVVLYDQDIVLGGGVIAQAIK